MAYKLTEAWQRTRRNHLLTYPECRVCGVEAPVVVHHIRYRGPRGTAEMSGDLVTLCEDHHNELHRTHGRQGSITDHSLAFIRSRAIDLAERNI